MVYGNLIDRLPHPLFEICADENYLKWAGRIEQRGVGGTKCRQKKTLSVTKAMVNVCLIGGPHRVFGER